MAASEDAPKKQPTPPVAPRERLPRLRRVALVIALILGVFVDGFFAVVNFYPVAPKRSRGPRRYVVAVLDDEQARWFRENMLQEFNDANETNLELRIADDDSMEASIASPDVVAAILPLPVARQAAEHGALQPIDGVASPGELADGFGAMRAELMTAARFRGRQYFVPRMVVVDVGTYRVTRVRDAILHWHLVQPEIDAALRAANGRGLPAGYTLEQEPPAWDSYDQFVMAFYWAHRSYGGQPARGRVAHRSGLSDEAQQDVLAGIYRAGATDATIGDRAAAASADWYAWEALYRRLGLYAPEMFAPSGMDDAGVENGLAHGEIFLGSIDQIEAFKLHGGGHRGARPRVPDEDDLGFVATPHFASLQLDVHGHPVRSASSFSFREESVWVLPVHSADPRTGYRFAAWVMSAENHPRGCEALGLLPIRTDTIRERVTRFRSPWMLDIFDATLAQWPRSQQVPEAMRGGLGLDYAITWDTAIRRNRIAPEDHAALMAALHAPVDRSAAYATPVPSVGDPPDPTDTDEDSTGAHADAGHDSRAIRSFAVQPLREPLVFQWHPGDGGDVDAEVRR